MITGWVTTIPRRRSARGRRATGTHGRAGRSVHEGGWAAVEGRGRSVVTHGRSVMRRSVRGRVVIGRHACIGRRVLVEVGRGRSHLVVRSGAMWWRAVVSVTRWSVVVGTGTVRCVGWAGRSAVFSLVQLRLATVLVELEASTVLLLRVFLD